MRTALTLCTFCVFLQLGFAQTINFSEHIAPIIYENCTTCHRAGEVAPIPLTSYEEVKNWANMIEYVTRIRYMPPWKPTPGYSKFLGERYLSDEQIQMISDWVDAGTPQGDPMKEPPLPYFPDGSQLGEPDLVLTFEQSYTHKGTNEDEYRVFVLPTDLPEDKQIAAVELRPGNRRVVHHALFSYDLSGRARTLDRRDSEYGYRSFGGFGVEENILETVQYPGYVPGQTPRFFPEGLGQTLPKGADFLVQMHYAPVPTDEVDSSTVNIFFKEEAVEREVQTVILVPLPQIIDEAFVIPPNRVKTFTGKVTVPEKVSLVSISPHMHLLGKNWDVFAIPPNSNDTIPLIKIEDWDFNWQGSYNFDRYIVLEAGTEIHAIATYDNTVDNPFNPNYPPRTVTWGERTTDEMYYLPISFVDYKEGDEDIIFEEDVTTSVENIVTVTPDAVKLYPIFPNPTGGNINVGFQLGRGSNITFQITDLEGKVLKQITNKIFYPIGYHQMDIAVSDLPNGLYTLNMIGDTFQKVEKFSVLK